MSLHPSLVNTYNQLPVNYWAALLASPFPLILQFDLTDLLDQIQSCMSYI